MVTMLILMLGNSSQMEDGLGGVVYAHLVIVSCLFESGTIPISHGT